MKRCLASPPTIKRTNWANNGIKNLSSFYKGHYIVKGNWPFLALNIVTQWLKICFPLFLKRKFTMHVFKINIIILLQLSLLIIIFFIIIIIGSVTSLWTGGSVCWYVGLSVCHNVLKGRELTLLCSYLSTYYYCYHNHFYYIMIMIIIIIIFYILASWFSCSFIHVLL